MSTQTLLIIVFAIIFLAILAYVIFQLFKIRKSVIDLSGLSKQAGILKGKGRKKSRPRSNSWWSLETPEIKLPISTLKLPGGRPRADEIMRAKQIIENILKDLNIKIEIMNEPRVGPEVTIYSFKPFAPLGAEQIPIAQNQLAKALLIQPVRIEAPISGTDLVGIEVPNRIEGLVELKNELETKEFKNTKEDLVVPFGRDVKYKQWLVNLHNLPNLLIGGATGTGKSVFICSLITSLTIRHSPRSLRFILADSKRIELPIFDDFPYLLTPAIMSYQKLVDALDWCWGEIELRLKTFSAAETSNLEEFNKAREEKLPYIVFIVDEVSDFGIGDQKKVLQEKMIRLLQSGRSAGIHLIVSSARLHDQVFSGLLNANISARLCFAAASEGDSQAILNTGGAEKLLSEGEALYINSEMSQPIKLHIPYISIKTMEKAVNYLRQTGGYSHPVDVIGLATSSSDFDEMFEQAKSLVIERGHASISLLQRKLQIEYARASYILDQLENFGIIGPANGANPRAVYITPEMYRKMKKRAALESESAMIKDDLLDKAKDLVMKSGIASAAYLERKLNIGYARSARLLDLMEEQGIIGPGVGALPRKVIKNYYDSAANTSSEEEAAKKMNIKILHFEDDAAFSRLYGERFKKQGFAYINYNSPSKNPAEIVLREKPDLIIMDIIMPVVDGLTATEILKSRPETKNFPIFGLCNMSQKEDVDKAINLGMIDYFIKQHFIPDDVIDKIKEYLRNPAKYKRSSGSAG